MTLAIALVLALASTALVNVAYLQEHAAASSLQPRSPRRPLSSLRVLLSDRRWVVGIGMESAAFALSVVALALAPLALVQSVGVGGIGLHALGTARFVARADRDGHAGAGQAQREAEAEGAGTALAAGLSWRARGRG